MTQVQKIYQYEDVSLQSTEQNKFESVEKIVDEIVQNGMPKNLTLSAFIVKVSETYNINVKEAKTCIKLAMNELDKGINNFEKEDSDKLNAECGYYYPQGFSMGINEKKDGMDSLSCLSSYNRLMFGVR